MQIYSGNRCNLDTVRRTDGARSAAASEKPVKIPFLLPQAGIAVNGENLTRNSPLSRKQNPKFTNQF